MKAYLVSLIVLTSLNSFAISFITEDDVQQGLEAQKVIEISKYSVADKLVKENSDCYEATMSKSARAYVVKKDNKSFIYVTAENLEDIQLCGEI